MNLDQLATAIEVASPDQNGRGLADLLRSWKADSKTAKDLANAVERYIGNAWFASDELHNAIYSLWSKFRDEAIRGIGGMTMNERLYWFGLSGRFDGAGPSEKAVIYNKLHARP